MTQTTRPVFKFAHLKHTLLVAAMGLAASPAWSQQDTGGDGATATATTVSPSQYFTLINYAYMVQINITTLMETWTAVKKIKIMKDFDIYDSSSRLQPEGFQPRSGLDGQTGLAGAAGDSPWSAWALASRNNTSYSFQPLASTSRSNNAMAGVGYSLAGGSEVGVGLASDVTDVTTSLNARSLNYKGYNVLPYFFVPLAPQWTLDGTLGFGGANVKANVGGNVTGESRESRRFGALGVNYFTSAGDWRLVGTGGLQSYSSTQQQFTLSNATVIAATSNNLTQLTIGGQAFYGSGQFVPFVGVNYSHDISRTAPQAVAGQTPSDARGTFSGRVGFSFRPNKQVSASVQLASDRRTQFRNNGLLATINIRF